MASVRVKLDHYHITELRVAPIADYVVPVGPDSPLYADFSGAEFGITVNSAEGKENQGEADRKFLVSLVLQAKPLASAFPYDFAIALDGFFRAVLPDQAEPDQEGLNVKDLVTRTGAGMLYGAAREIMISLTSRFSQGAVLLPAVNFAVLHRRAERARAAAAAKRKARTVKKLEKTPPAPKVKGTRNVIG